MTAPAGAILFNNSTGSDSLASGLGPSTAVNSTTAGTTASYSGTTITFSGATDLSGVTAGHLLYLVTSTGRKFFIIASVNDGADTLTLDDTPTGTASGLSWAIGGKRATLAASSKAILTESKAGWIVEMGDGDTQTLTTVTLTVHGDTTSGPIILRGEANATVKPIVQFTDNSNGFYIQSNYRQFIDFDVINTNATKTASYAFRVENSGRQYHRFENIVVGNATNYFYRGITYGGGDLLDRCTITHCASHGALSTGNATASDTAVRRCVFSDNGGDGFTSTNDVDVCLDNCLFINNGATGARLATFGNSIRRVTNCLFYNNVTDGLYLPGTSGKGPSVTGCLFCLNGEHGIGIDMSQVQFTGSGSLIRNNGFYANVVDEVETIDVGSDNITLTADPFVDAAAGDFNLNTTAGGGQALRDATYTLP